MAGSVTVPGKQAASGAGFLRMRPGGRLKPHFGNAPRDLDAERKNLVTSDLLLCSRCWNLVG